MVPTTIEQVVARPDGGRIDLLKLTVDLTQWRVNAPEGEREARDRAAQKIRQCAKEQRQILTLCGLGLSGLPEAIGNLKHVTSLDVSENPALEQLPPCIFELSNLDTLNAMNCGLKAVPNDIARLRQLESLYLGNNDKLDELPNSVCDLGRLKDLFLDGCNFTELPARIDLYRVAVSFLPPEVRPPIRNVCFDSESRDRIEKSARECRDRWECLLTAFPPEQRESADERDRVKRGRLSTTVSHMAASGEEPKDGPTFRNWVQADKMTAEWARDGHQITEERLLQLHRLLYRDVHNSRMSKTLDESGRWRKSDLWAGQTPFPYAAQIPGMMAEFLQWYDHTRDSLAGSDSLADHIAFAGQIYQRLVSIHPFADGNGRIGRLSMDWALREAGLPPARLRRDHAGAPVAVVLTAVQGERNKKPEVVAELVLEGIQNTLRLYEAELRSAPLGIDGSDMPSDDEEVLAEVSRDLSKQGFFHLPEIGRA